MPKRTLSLSNELHLAMGAIRGVHRLTRYWIENYGMDDPDLPEGVASMLALVIERLRLLDRVARGTLDPRLAWCPENDAEIAPGDPSEEDVRLEAWSDGKLPRHHRAEWKRARTRASSRRRTKEQLTATAKNPSK
jgi:hypothetical protein